MFIGCAVSSGANCHIVHGDYLRLPWFTAWGLHNLLSGIAGIRVRSRSWKHIKRINIAPIDWVYCCRSCRETVMTSRGEEAWHSPFSWKKVVSRVSIVGFVAYWKVGRLFLVLGSSCSENWMSRAGFYGPKGERRLLILIASCLLLIKSEREHQSWGCAVRFDLR